MPKQAGDPIESNIPAFLSDPNFRQYVSAFVIVAGDVMGMMGVQRYLVEDHAVVDDIFLVDPKDRNPVSTRQRVREVLPDYPIFNSMNPSEVSQVAKQLLRQS